MSVSWAVDRFVWRFKEKHFKANAKDVEALNIIINWVNTVKQEQVDQQRLFAKLFIKRLDYEIYRTKNLKMAVDTIDRDLRVSMESHVKTFRINMIMHDFDMACQTIGMPDEPDYTKGVTVEERRAYTKKVYECAKANDGVLTKTLLAKHWTLENTYERLNDLISDMIHFHGDKD